MAPFFIFLFSLPFSSFCQASESPSVAKIILLKGSVNKRNWKSLLIDDKYDDLYLFAQIVCSPPSKKWKLLLQNFLPEDKKPVHPYAKFNYAKVRGFCLYGISEMEFAFFTCFLLQDPDLYEKFYTIIENKFKNDNEYYMLNQLSNFSPSNLKLFLKDFKIKC